MNNRTKRRGATIVEFAIVLPLLVVLVFGSVEFTRVAMLRHTANHAAHLATRKAIIPGADVADAIHAAESHLQTIGINGAAVSISPSNIVNSTELVSVEVSFPVATNSLIVPEFVSGQIVGKSAMVTERPKAIMALNLPEPPPPPPAPTPPSSTLPTPIMPPLIDLWPTIPPPAPPVPVL